MSQVLVEDHSLSNKTTSTLCMKCQGIERRKQQTNSLELDFPRKMGKGVCRNEKDDTHSRQREENESRP